MNQYFILGEQYTDNKQQQQQEKEKIAQPLNTNRNIVLGQNTALTLMLPTWKDNK